MPVSKEKRLFWIKTEKRIVRAEVETKFATWLNARWMQQLHVAMRALP